MISVVIPNWGRPSTLTDIILPVVERYAKVSEIIISHGKKETAFSYKSRHCRIVHREDWGLNETYGIARRFWAAKEADNEIIFQQDDDILHPEKTMEQLLVHFRRQPDIIHGMVGRKIDSSFCYNFIAPRVTDVLVVLGKSMMFKKTLSDMFTGEDFAPMQQFMENSNASIFWNGEDIFQSLVAYKYSDSLNKIHNLPKVNLERIVNNTEAISSHPTHLAGRTAFLRYAVDEMGLRERLTGILDPAPSDAGTLCQKKSAKKTLKVRLLLRILKSGVPPIVKCKALTYFYNKRILKRRLRQILRTIKHSIFS